MTSEVMAGMTARAQIPGMKKVLPAVAFFAFTAYTLLVVERHGYFGFVELALREPWGMQLLLDLSISILLIGAWIRRDARARGISAWPYLAALPFLGSVGTLAYIVHRTLKGPARGASTTSHLSAPSHRRQFS